MADDTVTIRFGARIEDLVKGVDGVKEKLSELGEMAKGIGEAFAIGFGGRELIEFVKGMGELGEQTERMAMTLGVSTESIGQLGAIAAMTGTSTESMAMSIERLSLNVQRATKDAFTPGAAALKVLGLNAKELVGLPADKYLEKLAEAAGKLNPSLNLTNALMAIGGRGVAQLVPTLVQGRERLEQFGDIAKATGTALSDETTKGMVETQHAMVTLGLAVKGFGIAVFEEFKPVIDAVVKSLTAAVASALALFKAFSIIGGMKVGFGADIVAESKRVSTELEKIARDWKAMMNVVFGGGEHEGHGTKGDAGAMDEDAKKRQAAAAVAIQEQIKQADFAYNMEKERIETAAKLFQMTESEKTSALLGALNTRDAAEQTLLGEELKLYARGSVEYARVLAKMSDDHAKFVLERLKTTDAEIIAEQKSWEMSLGQVQSAWDSQLKGLLDKTKTWKEAMKAMFADMIMTMIKNMEKMLIINTIAAQMQKAFGTISGAVDLSGFIKQIGAAIAATYAGAAAFFAPTLGPFAPAAAAVVAGVVGAAAAGLMAFSGPKAEQGAFNVPETSPWLLHKGETVLPAAAAEGFRRMANAGAGGGLGGGVHIHIHGTVDGTDALRVFTRHADTLSRVVAGHMGKNPSTYG